MSSRKRSKSNDKPIEQATQPLSKRKRLLFICGAVALPLVAFALIELILRAFGFGGYPPTFVKAGQTAQGTLVITDTPGPASFFFANRSKPGSIDQYAFFSPKPADTIRVMIVGESAAKGFPQTMGFASSAFLREMLRDAWPGKNVEVVNLGTTAIASFPVLEIMTESLDYEPDLIIAYLGNNEFFGAYGVSSLHSAGRSPFAIETLRNVRSLAMVQAIDRLIHPPAGLPDRTLMEAMMGRSYTPANDPSRASAARNLEVHVGKMIERCKARGVPIVVCTPPCNERDLAPLGKPDTSSADSNASPHYQLGRTLYEKGQFDAAAIEFARAIELDTMPWRAPGGNVEAIKRSVAAHGAVLCDLQQSFRDASPGKCIGWELMDDHVHPSLAGQALVARSIVKTLTNFPAGKLNVPNSTFEQLATDETYFKRLGDNPYDRYGVAHTVRVLCNIPFFKETNPSAFERFNRMATDAEAIMSPAALDAVREWQKPTTHGKGHRPISGVVARALMRDKQFADAERLLVTAQRNVPLYTSWNLEYVYFMLACREKVNQKLSDDDLRIAQDAIDRGKFLLAHGSSESGMAERYVGRMHQLRGEFAEAIPFLLSARPKVGGTDRVGIDQALVLSYVKTGKLAEARAVVNEGVIKSGEFAEMYRQLGAAIPER